MATTIIKNAQGGAEPMKRVRIFVFFFILVVVGLVGCSNASTVIKEV